ncbi:hypothetical protein FALBO_2291 [Fusarium albosuccineum]|uniref:Hydrophobin n=1 Tax=Fusarium albosuccineum TaxID=1237068 RepID=A0A8H4LLQ3_9HYPO|nr:hypothetical protein FALBO_2291 [Fusarium albosuccineum]
MQFSILALTLAATGALALPGREKPQKPGKPQPGNVQTISCSSGSPYCCNQEFDAKKGKSYYKCSEFVNNCNAVAVCCNNNVSYVPVSESIRLIFDGRDLVPLRLAPAWVTPPSSSSSTKFFRTTRPKSIMATPLARALALEVAHKQLLSTLA